MSSTYQDDYIPTTFNENRADAIELGPSAGAGLVPPERQPGNMGQDYRAAIKAVVHPETLREWSDAGIAYQILPEEQVGIGYIMQTKDSPWRDIAVKKLVRARREGEEVLMAHVIERAENPMHNEVTWDHLVGVRIKSRFQQEFDGVRIKAVRKINSEPVYYIKWSKEAAEEILKHHNVKKVETRFILDAGYTKFGSITRDHFLNLSYEQLHDRYLRGVNYGTVAAEQRLSGQRQFPGGQVNIEAPDYKSPQAYPGLSAVTAEQIARLYSSGDDGKRMADNIMSQMPPAKALEVAYSAQQYLQSIKAQKEKGGQVIQEPTTGQAVEVSFPMSGGTAGRADISPAPLPPSSGGGGGGTATFKNDKVPYKETSGFVTIRHDEKTGKPTQRISLDKEGKQVVTVLSPEEAAKIEQDEELLKQGINPADVAELQKQRQENDKRTVGNLEQTLTQTIRPLSGNKPEKNTAPPIEEILEDVDDDGNPSPLKKKKDKKPSDHRDEPDEGDEAATIGDIRTK